MVKEYNHSQTLVEGVFKLNSIIELLQDKTVTRLQITELFQKELDIPVASAYRIIKSLIGSGMIVEAGWIYGSKGQHVTTYRIAIKFHIEWLALTRIEDLKVSTKSKILVSLSRSRKELTELRDDIKISLPTCLKFVKELEEDGLVVTRRGKSNKRGRKPLICKLKHYEVT